VVEWRTRVTFHRDAIHLVTRGRDEDDETLPRPTLFQSRATRRGSEPDWLSLMRREFNVLRRKRSSSSTLEGLIRIPLQLLRLSSSSSSSSSSS
jgi:hypothetical protein